MKLDKDRLERRWDAPSWLSSHWYWESYLMRLQVVYTETLESPRLVWRETLNSTHCKRFSTTWFFQRLCWCKEDKAVRVQLKPVALMVYIDVNLKLLVGLQVWDDWLEPHALLGVNSLIWRSPQENLDRFIWLKLAELFGESEVPLLQGVELF